MIKAVIDQLPLNLLITCQLSTQTTQATRTCVYPFHCHFYQNSPENKQGVDQSYSVYKSLTAGNT